MNALSNKKSGNAFELEYANILSKNGFWACVIPPNREGKQPADIFAIKDGKPYLIDCKVCDKPYLLLSRIEENQINSMRKFKSRGGKCAFACKHKEQITHIAFDDVEYAIKNNLKRIDI